MINSKYSEVYWTMMDPVPLEQAVIDKFKGKTLAIVGYETDQVMRTPTGDVSVPITHAYNHHYCAYMSGSLSEMRSITGEYQTKMSVIKGLSVQESWQGTTA